MNVKEHHLSDSQLRPYLDRQDDSPLDTDRRVSALIDHQADPQKGWPRLVKNLETYSRGSSTVVEVDTIPLLLMLNITRAPSLKANTFEKGREKSDRKTCFLCQLDECQRGLLILNERYIVLTNPGMTVPGDLTISAVDHKPQLIGGRFGDMLEIARQLYSFTLYFNGALAGASSPHFHFQGGRQNALIAEEQLHRLINREPLGKARLKEIMIRPDLAMFSVENFLRPVVIVRSPQADILHRFFDFLFAILAELNHHIKGLENIPDFGIYVESLQTIETEPRFNLALKFDPASEEYELLLFPKYYNRPGSYFRKGKDQILLGLAIKEALGNLITCRERDYRKLQKDTHLIRAAYRDTSISREMTNALLSRLAGFQ